MKPIKLSPIKRMMMFVLSLLVHNVYHTDAFGWTVVSLGTYSSCQIRCQYEASGNNAAGYVVGNMRNYKLEFPSYYSNYNTLTSYCLCLKTAELTSLNNCATVSCSSLSYMSGVRAHMLNSTNMSGLTCNQGYSACTCIPGTYVSAQTCAVCAPGYYCSGGGALYPIGVTGTFGSAQCPSPGTSPAKSSTINSCYVPMNTTGTDTKGAWKYSSDCFYAS